MNLTISATPSLCSISQCKIALDFQPLSHWPASLPAVAVNSWVLAGFSQDLVFNHQIDESDFTELTQLFRSLYTDLSFMEIVRLWDKSKNVLWFPFAHIANAYGIRLNEQFEQMAQSSLNLPIGFQNWCAQKKVGLSDLLPILSANSLDMNPILKQILLLKLSKNDGILALELGIDLLLMGRNFAELLPEEIAHNGSLWVEHLKNLRFPNAKAQAQSAEKNISHLPWPGTSQVKWTRLGDRAGIEVKLFVSQPEDLKRYAKSFEKIQDLLESNQEELWKKH